MAEVHYCSIPKILRHAEICKEINRLYEQKNHDYMHTMLYAELEKEVTKDE